MNALAVGSMVNYKPPAITRRQPFIAGEWKVLIVNLSFEQNLNQSAPLWDLG